MTLNPITSTTSSSSSSSSSHNTPPKQSPKRKRSNSKSTSTFISTSTFSQATDFIFAPDVTIESNIKSDREVEVEAQRPPALVLDDQKTLRQGAGSPGTVVADKFKNLALRGGGSSSGGGGGGGSFSRSIIPAIDFGLKASDAAVAVAVERKRIRLEGDHDVKRDDRGEDGDGRSLRHYAAISGRKGRGRGGGKGDVQDASQIYHHHHHHQHEHNAALIPAPSLTTTKSPPPPEHTSLSNIELSTSTWQASEITGHLALDPDDDGYGINGIGFKPTPAQVYARSQRRKQQVLDWRSREAKEARQKRAAGRKGKGKGIGNGIGDGGINTVRTGDHDCGKAERSVRFAF